MAADLIRVGVEPKGPVRDYVSLNEVLVPKGATMSRLVSILNIPDGLRVICMRDGKRIAPSAQLRDGDSIVIVSMVAGG